MTSSRKRRTRSTRPSLPLRRIAAISLGLMAFAAAFAAAFVAWFALAPARRDADAARDAAAQSATLLAAGNATAARTQALAAVRADPDNGEAHLALARAMLAQGDGVSADAEIQRAIDAHVDARRVQHLRAHALLLAGEEEKAIAAADKAAPQFRVYALRIRGRALAALGNGAAAFQALDQAVRAAPGDGAAWADMGRFKLNAGDLLGAIDASARAVRFAPGNVDALILRGELVRSQYGLTAALPWFEAALKHDGYNADALIEYAATLGDAGRTVDAVAATRRALEVRPASPQAYYLQAVIAARGGNYDLSRSLLDKTGGSLDALPGTMLLTGTLDIEKGDFEQAIDKLKALVGNQPYNVTARKLLAYALLRTNSARNAIDMLRPVVERADADSYALTLAARGYERIGDRAAAARYLDRAAAPLPGATQAFSADDSTAVLAADADQRPDDPATIVPLIRGLASQGDRAGALTRAQRTASAYPGAPAAQLLIGDLLMLDNRFADAATAYRGAADLRFDQSTALRLVEALDKANRRPEAANALALYLSQNPADLAALRLSAEWQLAAGDYAAAVDTLERLRGWIGDGDAVLNAELAAAYTGAGDADAAEELGEAAYALAPANPVVADAYGWALYRGGDLHGAAELIGKAVILAPRHAGLRWHLAQVYADLGHKREAKFNAQVALADPRFADRAAAQALVARLG
ncbi:tetratricopeptide repeat protein [Sphingomonas sp. MMS12-HWE2-04]|uniref:tetratricopeptide repeat protein n=1 Tax=Sphingomonas sp. MMS12-HWE2-04 TaxID=3234199 RepID=UPI00384E89FD